MKASASMGEGRCQAILVTRSRTEGMLLDSILFASWESTYGQGPAFNIERVGRFPGGTMRFRLEVRRGVIRPFAISAGETR